MYKQKGPKLILVIRHIRLGWLSKI